MNHGFVIERCSDGSRFVWFFAGSLPSTGTIDGKNYTEKFGRRNYGIIKRDDKRDELTKYYIETLDDKLFSKLESVKKYGVYFVL